MVRNAILSDTAGPHTQRAGRGAAALAWAGRTGVGVRVGVWRAQGSCAEERGAPRGARAKATDLIVECSGVEKRE